MSELWKKPRRNLMGGVGVDAHARSEPPPHSMLLPEGDDELASTNDTVFGARRSRFLREDIQPCTSFVGISSSTADRYCCRDRASSSCLPGASSLRRLERPPASFREPRPVSAGPSSAQRVSPAEASPRAGQLVVAHRRLRGRPAARQARGPRRVRQALPLRAPVPRGESCAPATCLSAGGRRCRSADVVEVARNVVIWVLVLSGTATIMFGAVGIIVLRTGSVMFLSSAVGSVLTTAGVLMAIYCTDASTDRGLQRMMNHKYNYT
ncbi:hypothetical protein MTO96_014477 [Rhipicephalus appendiculatus]